MGIKVLGWFTPVRIALTGAVLVALLLAAPISFRAPGDHEMTNCGSTLTFNPQGYAKAGERHYWDDFVHRCTMGRTTRLAQALGLLAVTGVLVTFALTRPPNRRTVVAADDAQPA